MIRDIQSFPKKLIDDIDINSQLRAENITMNVVLPRDLITSEKGFMHGHGTFEENGKIYSNVVGTVEKTNKLILVKPVKSKYYGNIGDIVIGRITEISNRRWLVDIGSHSYAYLNLNSIHLPSGAQKRKTEEDELNMRTYFDENDIILTEIQAFNNDKTINLHTRNTNYGKLANGTCIEVNHVLIKAQKNHIIQLKNKVSLILAHNGRVWISWGDENVGSKEREIIAKIRNCVKILDEEFIDITIDNITELYESVCEKNLAAKDILLRENKQVLQSLKAKLETKIPEEIKKLQKQKNILSEF